MTETTVEPQSTRRRGCLFYGCLGATILVLVAVIAGYLGFRTAVERFTDAKPLALPETRLTAGQMQQLHERIATFNRAVDEKQSPAPLILTADEVNALIQTDPDWASLKGQLYVVFEGSRLEAQISVPAERLGSPRLRGRYLNATGRFAVSIRNGQLQVTAETLSAKGRTVPDRFMEQLHERNFALGFTNAAANAALGKFQRIEIKDGKLVIDAKP